MITETQSRMKRSAISMELINYAYWLTEHLRHSFNLSFTPTLIGYSFQISITHRARILRLTQHISTHLGQKETVQSLTNMPR